MHFMTVHSLCCRKLGTLVTNKIKVDVQNRPSSESIRYMCACEVDMGACVSEVDIGTCVCKVDIGTLL